MIMRYPMYHFNYMSKDLGMEDRELLVVTDSPAQDEPCEPALLVIPYNGSIVIRSTSDTAESISIPLSMLKDFKSALKAATEQCKLITPE
jgi:hypothetical protein